MNRPVCCCSETCPVHCLVPSPAGESHPAHGQEGRGPGGLERERVGGGVLRPDHLPHSFWWLLSQRGGPSPACEVRTHLGDSGGGGRLGVLGWGPRSPPVLHILIHPIFGTRKGTNISVLNSFPSPPLQPPTGSAAAAQSSISGPSLPLPPHVGRGTLQLVWGWPGS